MKALHIPIFVDVALKRSPGQGIDKMEKLFGVVGSNLHTPSPTQEDQGTPLHAGINSWIRNKHL